VCHSGVERWTLRRKKTPGALRFTLKQAQQTVFVGDLAGLAVRMLRALVGHLEEQQIRQLLDIVAVAHPIVAEDVAVVPEFLDDLLGVISHENPEPLLVFAWRSDGVPRFHRHRNASHGNTIGESSGRTASRTSRTAATARRASSRSISSQTPGYRVSIA
jgi:hypothetical protein